MSLTVVEVKIDGGAYQPAVGTSVWSYALDTSGLADGLHTITARATSSTGLTATATRTVRIGVPIGSILWNGNFEPADGAINAGLTNTVIASGDINANGNYGLEQYNKDAHFWQHADYNVNVVPNSRYPTGSPAPRQGTYCSRWELRDNTDISFSNQRCQLIGSSGASGIGEGVEDWWGMSVWIPTSWTERGSGTGNHWWFPYQWHMTPGGGQAPVNLNLSSQSTPGGSWTNNSDVRWRALLNDGTDPNGFTYHSTPMAVLTKNVWTDFVWHFKWSSTTAGLTECWINGALVLSENHRNLYAGNTNYLQIGMYRDSAIGSQVMYLDEFKRGDTMAIVTPG